METLHCCQLFLFRRITMACAFASFFMGSIASSQHSLIFDFKYLEAQNEIPPIFFILRQLPLLIFPGCPF